MKWILLAVFLCSCNLITERHDRQSSQPEWQNYLYQQSQATKQEAMRQLGFMDSSSLNEKQMYDLNMRVKLIELENALHNPSEINQYYENKSYFVNDRQRVHFLTISDYIQKENWLAKYINKSPERYPSSVKEAITKGDLVPNMTKEAVIESWGRPDEIQGSGNKVYGNEKWLYTIDVNTEEGIGRESRQLYFENGLLVGWKTQ